MPSKALVGQEVGNYKVLWEGLYILQPIIGTNMSTSASNDNLENGLFDNMCDTEDVLDTKM